MLKHPSKGSQGQVLKSSKGNIDEEIPDPYFLADPSHRVKVVAKYIISIVKKLGLSDVDEPNQMLFYSRNIGGTC